MDDASLSVASVFQSVDTDEDGMLTPHDVIECFVRWDISVNTDKVRHLVRRYGSNGDRRLTFSEFVGLVHLSHPKYFIQERYHELKQPLNLGLRYSQMRDLLEASSHKMSRDERISLVSKFQAPTSKYNSFIPYESACKLLSSGLVFLHEQPFLLPINPRARWGEIVVALHFVFGVGLWPSA
ncbi:unnamed protein product [Arabis nemorensis]|uniref:EF-hand domain-containing protein n=1 Tax=Arabis nemorensis TaxID=586526 RepID=A0A565AL84_9BRAS|nr:unnamed protein product [Arabis nemorensis]